MEEFKYHGCKFRRTGKCDITCTGCDHKCSICPHGKLEKGNWVCKIFNKLEEQCDICTKDKNSLWYRDGKKVTHKICKDFPDHPWLNVVRDGICGFTFKTVDGRDMDNLPFMNGKFLRNK